MLSQLEILIFQSSKHCEINVKVILNNFNAAPSIRNGVKCIFNLDYEKFRVNP